jgi:ribonuclease HI
LKNKRLVLHVDGASRGNPGPAGIGVVIADDKGKTVKTVYRYLGESTNNIAEYNALICGLEEALALAAGDIVVNIDSELVARQMNGEYRVKDEGIKPLFEKALGMLKNFKSFEIRHVDRSRNKEADKLANKAINLSGLA